MPTNQITKLLGGRMKNRLIILLTSTLLFGCGGDDDPNIIIRLKDTSSLVQCLTTVAGIEESFETSEGFEKSSKGGGFYYISCQKQTPNDNSTIAVEILVDDEVVDSGTASEEFGIAGASFLKDAVD